MGLPLLDLLGFGSKLLERFVPDPAKRAEAKLELVRMQEAGELARMADALQRDLGQMEINKVEAAAPDFFTRGWRPAVGWVCVAGLVYEWILRPVLIAGGITTVIEIPMGDLLTMLGGLLGLGWMRHKERLAGVA